MQPLYICGTGNLGTAMARVFEQKGIPVKGYFSGTKQAGFLEYGGFSPEKDSLVLLCVPDDAILECTSKLLANDPILIHCSGSLPLDILPSSRKGVFYPLQTFSRAQPLSDWKGLPVFIQANTQAVEQLLSEMAKTLGTEIHIGNDIQRAALHLAAVFVNNFSNLMFIKAWEICRENNLDPEILKPLIRQTILKLEHATPRESQTGPARRGDVKTIEKHLSLMAGNKELKALYQLISAAISDEYRNHDLR